MNKEDKDDIEVYVVSSFVKVAAKEGVDDAALKKAAFEIFAGLIDADLKGSLFKKRIASANRNTGKSDGNRAIVSMKRGKKLFYIYLFSKKEKDNISAKELKALKAYGELMFTYDDEYLEAMIAKGLLRKL
ncbi:type II toxin-antitoxin system RelE/ParE family toxin [Cronobacter turicensis]|nr:type II toxin-antitoxin system RelE/ParE family toxin [Cronobacter turicensis]